MNCTVYFTVNGASPIKNVASSSAKKITSRPREPIDATAMAVARQPLRMAPSGSLAPRYWPTKVAPAIEKPKPTVMQTISMLVPMLYAAKASVP